MSDYFDEVSETQFQKMVKKYQDLQSRAKELSKKHEELEADNKQLFESSEQQSRQYWNMVRDKDASMKELSEENERLKSALKLSENLITELDRTPDFYNIHDWREQVEKIMGDDTFFAALSGKDEVDQDE